MPRKNFDEFQDPISADAERVHEDFTGLLSGAGNHEAKLAVTAIIASQPGTWFSETTLSNEVRERQGEHPGWVPDRKLPASYCRDSLGPVGLVTKGSVPGLRGDVPAFAANDERPEVVERGLAMSGALMDWSLEYPELSVQKLLGVTAKRGGHRTPEARYRILQALAETGGEPTTYIDIAKGTATEEIDTYDIYASIRALADVGIIDAKIKDTARDFVLEITGPYSYSGHGTRFEGLPRTGQTAYRAIDQLWDQGRRTLTFADFTQAAQAVDPDVDLVRLRDYWHQGSNSRPENITNLKLAGKAMETQSSVTVKPEYVDGVTDLALTLLDLDSPQADLGVYKQTARDFIADPDKMSQLFAKARQYSSAVAGQENDNQVVELAIRTIIGEEGHVTTGGLRAYLAQRGRNLTAHAVSSHVRRMTNEGNLHMQKVQLDPSKVRLTNVYSLLEEDQD